VEIELSGAAGFYLLEITQDDAQVNIVKVLKE